MKFPDDERSEEGGYACLKFLGFREVTESSMIGCGRCLLGSIDTNHQMRILKFLLEIKKRYTKKLFKLEKHIRSKKIGFFRKSLQNILGHHQLER